MKIIKQSVSIEDLGARTGSDILKKIEKAGRTCYKSEDRINDKSALTFIGMLMKRGHESVLEHHNISIRFITDRGVTHEMVRHRIASYSQESTRYCNYGGNDIQFILPVEFYQAYEMWENNKPYKYKNNHPHAYSQWKALLIMAEKAYKNMLEEDAQPQLARSVLPNSLKTEIVMTANLREWRHFFKLRCAKAAHPQMRDLALMALEHLNNSIPVIFQDIVSDLKC